MIIDLANFITHERPYWTRLEAQLKRVQEEPNLIMPLEEARELHYLYERTSSDLAKISALAAARELRAYLESLVARAYGEIHSGRAAHEPRPWRYWFFGAFPRAFRRHIGAFWISVGITMLGVVAGAALFLLEPESKMTLLPFAHLEGTPSERVAKEESEASERHLGGGRKATFSAELMSNNIGVSLRAFAFGITWGIGTIILLFYNGAILGVVCVDYVLDGQTRFLLAWLLPHGVIEIPAILIGGQAGLIVAGAIIGWDTRRTMSQRFRAIGDDLVALLGGLAVMLVWAGLVEAFISQDHGPSIYAMKIFFGLIELGVLVGYLTFSGRSAASDRMESLGEGGARG